MSVFHRFPFVLFSLASFSFLLVALPLIPPCARAFLHACMHVSSVRAHHSLFFVALAQLIEELTEVFIW